ncbi:MAG: hypothetical protein J0I13_09010 [Rhizobiales bacterium]|nr:hypothetical protein [Hyphomicrobiales bacterium]
MTHPDKPFAQRNLPAKQVDYDVGYGKPPLTTRFRRGQSGNPSGRRKGSIKKRPALPALNDERLKTIILEEAYRSISINDPNGQIDIPIAQAVVRSLAVNAAKGNQRAQRLFTELLTSVERDNKKLHDEWLQTAINYKVEWDEELARRTKLGIVAPAPIPHPDDITIDMKIGSVRIKGPMTKEDKVRWDQLRSLKASIKTDIDELRCLLAEQPTEREGIEAEIQHSERIFQMISAMIED